MIRALFVQPQHLHSNSINLWPFLRTSMGCYDHQMIRKEFCSLTLPLKYSFIPLKVSNLVKLQPVRAFVPLACETFDVNNDARVKCNTEEFKESQRRLRIGLANKGKVPWNKGKKHSAETCARIRERTLEALKDPKVREKMSQTSRFHSEQSKRKIGSSQKKLWAERLKLKRSKEKFYSAWSQSIAEAAKRGGIGQQQLDWDSYERSKLDIAFKRLQFDEEKAKKKEQKKIQAENKVKERKDKQNAKLKDKKKDILRSKRRKGEGRLAASKELSISGRVTKILEKKAIDGPPGVGPINNSLQSALEKFDIESIKAERRRNTISLAEQIQAAKSKRSQTVTNGSTMISPKGQTKPSDLRFQKISA